MLEFLFSFLLVYTPALAVLIFSIIILIVINIFYKILINQNEAKQIKQKTKDISKEMKDAQKAGDTGRSKRLMSDLLTENNRMMKMTMKPMIVSLIVVMLLLPSLATFYSDKMVVIKDGAGSVVLDENTYAVQKIDNTVSIGDTSCQIPCQTEIGKYNYKISLENSNVKVAQIVATLPFVLPFLGSTFGWLGWYIICSVPLVIIIRKVMKIYM
ncbi:MAG: EMC3/TMCO1 family protein [Candidatus Aenigmatarchaeota archaeon]